MKNRSIVDRLVSNWPVKALSLAAAIILFLFHNYTTLSEKFVTVPLTVRFADGYTAGQSYPRKVRVVLRGQEKTLVGVQEEDIEARVDFSRRASEGTFKAPIVVRKKGTLDTADTLEISVEPLEITMKIERKARKSVEVVPGLRGFPAGGFGIEQYFVNPPKIEIEGPKSRLDKISSIPTDEIDLSGKKESFATRVKLMHDDVLVSFPTGDVVEFRAVIEEAVVMKTFDPVQLEPSSLAPELVSAEPLPAGTLRVQGGQIFIENLKPELIKLVVDFSGISAPGAYSLPVKSVVPPGLLVVKYEPTQVVVNLVRAGGER